MEIRDAVPEDAPAACEVMRRSISELCGAVHLPSGRGSAPISCGSSASEKLLEHSRLPLAWHDQRIVLGFA